eukprot:2336141-Pyramimonas_sp.AAC.1
MGPFDITAASWGGKWREAGMHAHMNRDLKGSASQFLVIQEAAQDLLGFLKQDPGMDEADSPAVTGHRPLRQFIGAAGVDRGSTTMIFTRPTHVKRDADSSVPPDQRWNRLDHPEEQS